MSAVPTDTGELEEPGNAEMKKVTMQLTAADVRNTDDLQRLLHARSKAAAVSTALSVTSYITKILNDGGSVLIRDESGNTKEMFWPGLSKT